MSRHIIDEVFTEVLALDGSVPWSEVRYQEVEAWDSLAHMAIIAEFEERFGVLFDTEDIVDMSSHEKAIAILGKYGVET